MKRKIVCLCGSTRFREAFEKANRDETAAGNIVLSVGWFTHENPVTENIKADLDRLHKDKIDIADEVLILNVKGYVGSSTLSEILHAFETKKTIRFLEPLPYDALLTLVNKARTAHLPPQEIRDPKTLPFVDIAVMHEMFFGDIQDKVKTMSRRDKAELLKFRLRFIQEEMRETDDANTAAEFVDGLVDMMVVIVGTLHMFGVDGEKAWNEVYQANIMKEVGVKASRPNPFGFPDLIKPEGWVGPDHTRNVGVLSEVFNKPLGDKDD